MGSNPAGPIFHCCLEQPIYFDDEDRESNEVTKVYEVTVNTGTSLSINLARVKISVIRGNDSSKWDYSYLFFDDK
ncbi:MAG: hypothetical protein ACK5NG_05790 [Chthoniobacterales bacterium]